MHDGDEDCWKCSGAGSWHDCGEDCCCCMYPDRDERVTCDECGGLGYFPDGGDVPVDDGGP
jgi:hypothetical protein